MHRLFSNHYVKYAHTSYTSLATKDLSYEEYEVKYSVP